MWNSATLIICFLCAAGTLSAHGDLHERLNGATKAIECNPADGTLYLIRADLHRLHGDYTAMAADLKTARRLTGGAGSGLLIQAQAALDLGQPQAAQHINQRFLVAHPTSCAGHRQSAEISLATGHAKKAVRELLQFLETTPTAPNDLWVFVTDLALAHDLDRCPRLAASIQKALENRSPVPQLLEQLCRLQVQMNQINKALGTLGQLEHLGTPAEVIAERKALLARDAGLMAIARNACRDGIEAIRKLPPRLRVRPLVRQRQLRLRQLIETLP